MKVIIISQPNPFPDELSWVKKLFTSGLEIFHLRKPGISVRDLEQFIQKIPVKYHSRIMLHDHHELMDKYDLRGVHYSEQRRENGNLNNPYTKSTSFHNLGQIKKEIDTFEYVFLSPIFNSISKSGYQAGFDLDDLKVCLKTSSFRVMALGGIDREKVLKVKEMGFAGLALLGAVWESDSPLKAFTEIKSLVTQL